MDNTEKSKVVFWQSGTYLIIDTIIGMVLGLVAYLSVAVWNCIVVYLIIYTMKQRNQPIGSGAFKVITVLNILYFSGILIYIGINIIMEIAFNVEVVNYGKIFISI